MNGQHHGHQHVHDAEGNHDAERDVAVECAGLGAFASPSQGSYYYCDHDDGVDDDDDVDEAG